MTKLFWALPAIVLAIGCSSESGDPGKNQQPGDPFDTELDTSKSGGPVAPGQIGVAYPAAPYGYAIGSVVPNFSFYGWANPTSAGFDTAKLEKISMADYYDPDGSKGSKVILINVSALWCGFCRAEHTTGTYSTPSGPITYIALDKEVNDRRDAGLRYLETLVQSNDPQIPADPLELAAWAKQYKMTIPIVVDPAAKLGPLRTDDGSWPINFVVSTRDMRIVAKVLGADPDSLWTAIDSELQ